MSKVRVCFLGTPAFAVTCLQKMLDDEHFEVAGIITQPDRPAGRKMILSPSPVKLVAQNRGIPVLSPESVNKSFILDEVQKWAAEIAVVVAFGQIVSQKFLDLFPAGCVNVHASLLPRWRGAAPIQRAIAAGDRETGVALQKMVKELDAGDVLGFRKILLDQDINALQLHDKLAILGGDLLSVELMDYLRGNLVPVPQNQSFITYAKKIEKSEAEINWSDTAEHLHNQVRGFCLGPGKWTLHNGKKLKIHKTLLVSGKTQSGTDAGEVTSVAADGIDVNTGLGVLRILELQPESRNRQSAKDFIASKQIQVGDLLGASKTGAPLES